MNHHLNALNLRLFNERSYLADSKSEGETSLRKVWIAQIEKEIALEDSFTSFEMSDDELLAKLMA